LLNATGFLALRSQKQQLAVQAPAATVNRRVVGSVLP